VCVVEHLKADRLHRLRCLASVCNRHSDAVDQFARKVEVCRRTCRMPNPQAERRPAAPDLSPHLPSEAAIAIAAA